VWNAASSSPATPSPKKPAAAGFFMPATTP
jgi:hypothetical protein